MKDTFKLPASLRRASGANYPLYVNQEHLLLSREYFRASGTWLSPSTVPSILHLEGAVCYTAVERALAEIVRRHSSLTTSFFHALVVQTYERLQELHNFASSGVFKPGLYRQSIAENVSVDLRVQDLSAATEEQKTLDIQAAIAQEAAAEFDYASPPLLSAKLLKLNRAEHLLVLVVDHVVSDAWSMRIVREEFVRLYWHFCGGVAHGLEDPPRSYVDYALLHEHKAESGGFDRAFTYWMGQWSRFSGARIGPQDLPYGTTPARTSSVTWRQANCSFEPGLSKAIKAFARHSKITPYTVFLAACALVMHDHTGKQRVAFWSHFANRTHPEFRRTVGWFANTHLLGFELSFETTMTQLVAQARSTLLEASTHQELPVALVWRRLGRYPRDPDARVLLDVDVIEELPTRPSGTDLAEITSVTHYTPVFGRFSNLGLRIKDYREYCQVSVQYSVSHFPTLDGDRFLADFRAAVERVLQRPNERVLAS